MKTEELAILGLLALGLAKPRRAEAKPVARAKPKPKPEQKPAYHPPTPHASEGVPIAPAPPHTGEKPKPLPVIPVRKEKKPTPRKRKHKKPPAYAPQQSMLPVPQRPVPPKPMPPPPVPVRMRAPPPKPAPRPAPQPPVPVRGHPRPRPAPLMGLVGFYRMYYGIECVEIKYDCKKVPTIIPARKPPGISEEEWKQWVEAQKKYAEMPVCKVKTVCRVPREVYEAYKRNPHYIPLKYALEGVDEIVPVDKPAPHKPPASPPPRPIPGLTHPLPPPFEPEKNMPLWLRGFYVKCLRANEQYQYFCYECKYHNAGCDACQYWKEKVDHYCGLYNKYAPDMGFPPIHIEPP